jgi:serine/threonine protein kinase
VTALEVGQNVGRYRVLRFLGAGAMGEVYLAEDPHIERKLAIKTVRVAGGRPQDVEDRKRRLLRESRAAGRMLHPNIVTLFDAGEFEGLLYLAFEFVEGVDLAGRIEKPPPLTLGEVLRIIGQVADALDYAHRQGIVHRDIKPSNILLDTAGKVKVADFGIAKVVGQNTELTVAGSVMGSPQYLSPEQIRGEELDGRSDIFSLGVVLYELLSGRRPFDGETITTLVYQILNKDPLVSSLRSVPPRLDQLLHHMMAKDREQRIATAAMVAEELAAISRDLPESILAAPAAEVEGELDTTRILPSRASAVPSGLVPPVTPPGGAVVAATAAAAPTPTGVAGAPATGPAAPPPVHPSAATWVPPPPLGPPPPTPQPPVAGPVLNMAPPPATQRSKVPWLALVAVLLLILVAVGGGAYWAYVHYIEPMMASRMAGDATTSTTSSDGSGASGPSGASGASTTSGSGASSGVEPPPISMGVPAATSPSSESPAPVTGSSTSTAIAPVPSAPSAQPAEPPPIQPSAPLPSAPPARSRNTGNDTSSPSSGRVSGSSGVRTPSTNEGSGAQAPSRHPSSSIPDRPAAETPAASLPTPREDRQASEPKADKVVRSGLEVAFKVSPADSYVLLDGTLIGRADEWNGEKDHRSYTLPGSGSYTIKLKHSGMEDMRVQVDASATRGVTPIIANLKPLPAENLEVGDLRTVRVRQGISLRVEPDSAQVQVDGQQRGVARQYPGHFGRSSELLLLDPGRHRVTLTLPGYRRYDFAVEVYAGAERDHEEVKVVLTRGSSG